jgi:hypothetical protein
MSVYGHNVDSPKIRALREELLAARIAADAARAEEQRAKDAYSAALRVSNGAYDRLMSEVDAEETRMRRHASDVNLGRALERDQ